MDINLNNGKRVEIRTYMEEDFPVIHKLNKKEGWNNLVKKQEDAKEAWKQSNIAFVAYIEGKIIGYIRGMTDQAITTFICELLIEKEFRGVGLGQNLLYYVHSLYPKTRVEMLASSTSQSYYEQQGYRPFYGFRKTLEEYE